MFLCAQELEILTGFRRKARQIEQLKRMRIPFFVNGGGRAVVTRAAIEGRHEERQPTAWSPSLLQSRHPKHEVLNGTSTKH